jgi:mannose-1-phosphate guanylyltransferase
MKNVILCGGNGTRLWPLSRKLMPKQFLKIFNGKSLFQKTIERNSLFCNNFAIVTNEEQYFLSLDQLEELDSQKLVIKPKFFLEEMGKNTAPAIAFVAFESNEEDILFVTPSDHLIKNEQEYKKTVLKAKELAEKGYLVTFGIKPTEPNTGYGYIESKGKLKINGELKSLDVVQFHEKPDIETAKKYLMVNNRYTDNQSTSYYFWNSGMFMFKAGIYLEELQKHAPEIYEACKKIYENNIIHYSSLTNHCFRITNMQEIPDISIDYAVMEKSDKIKVVPSNFEWNDVGSFDCLIDEIDSKEAIEIDSKNNFYYSDNNKKVIATIDLEDFIIIDTKDALLITKKGQTQKVKNIVEQLKINHYPLLTTHSTVHRPWGTFETLIDENGYKIKRIIVKPGKRLSLQKHFHRSEHWIVVSGTATVTVGNEKKLVRPNESTYINMGEIHRLENEGKIPVVLIEAQVGEYTGEDDIVRLEDDYNRKS